MKKLQDIYALLSDCNIILEYQVLPDHILGIYHGDSNVDLIIINQYITSKEMKHKIILAEELGHYFTTIGNNTPKKYYKYSDKLKIDKCEEAAMRWSLNFLVPTGELIEYLKDHNYIDLEMCCDYFEVPRDFMIRKFEVIAKEKCYWKLDNNRYLVLSNLPSIFIMNKFGNTE